MTVNKIYLVGIGYKPFEQRAKDILFSADTILASRRLFEVFQGYEEFASVQEKVMVINRIDETLEFIRSNFEKRAIVLLASGDPMFFGIGRRITAEFGRDFIEILPDLSSVQKAFSTIKEAWDDAFLMSLHGGPDPEKRRRLPYEIKDIPLLLGKYSKIAILTDGENSPAAIASALSSSSAGSPRPDGLLMYVCERLGYADEKITSGPPGDMMKMTFGDPNVVILIDRKGDAIPLRTPDTPFGLTEEEISHSRGLITKDEVRAVSVHKLRLPRQGVLWDVGAGSGSLSVEAARLFPGLKVYAIEKNEEQLSHIEENKSKFAAPNVVITAGEAPEVLRDLPAPDRVFIGGSGGQLSKIIRGVREKMPSGVVVLNAVTLETLNEALLLLENTGFATEVSQVAVSRSRFLGGQRQLAALNPVFVIRGERR